MNCQECGREITSCTTVNGRIVCDWCRPKTDDRARSLALMEAADKAYAGLPNFETKHHADRTPQTLWCNGYCAGFAAGQAERAEEAETLASELNRVLDEYDYPEKGMAILTKYGWDKRLAVETRATNSSALEAQLHAKDIQLNALSEQLAEAREDLKHETGAHKITANDFLDALKERDRLSAENEKLKSLGDNLPAYLHEIVRSDNDRLRAEVERLRGEAKYIVEQNQALADRCAKAEAEAERLKGAKRRKWVST